MINIRKLIDNLAITSLSMDSRKIQPGDLFFALNANYIDEAVQKGARVIVTEKIPSKKYDIPVIQLDNLRHQIGNFAAEFYHHPSKHLHVIGVTGTNGKTSCTHFLAQAFKMAGLKSAVIGTLGSGLIEQLIPGRHTTPDPILLQQIMADFYHQKVEVAAIEASSHGLVQGRLNGVKIETGVFTNLTHDHLDYHITMDNYARAKFRLFEHPDLKYVVLNLDDPYGKKWAKKLSNSPLKLVLYGITCYPQQTLPDLDINIISATDIKTNPQGLNALLQTPWGESMLKTSLIGKFNLSNLLCVVAVLGIYHIPLEDIATYISHLKTVPGRMEMLSGTGGKPLIIIDYAHTPDALSKTLQAIRTHCTGKIWCIFGCGGNRDQDKRAKMGAIAQNFSDYLILTDDNPRTESPVQIIADICEGFTFSQSVFIEHDRRLAIAHALNNAKEKDIILIAGKGHESYQEIGDQKLPFNDKLTVISLLEQG